MVVLLLKEEVKCGMNRTLLSLGHDVIFCKQKTGYHNKDCQSWEGPQNRECQVWEQYGPLEQAISEMERSLDQGMSEMRRDLEYSMSELEGPLEPRMSGIEGPLEHRISELGGHLKHRISELGEKADKECQGGTLEDRCHVRAYRTQNIECQGQIKRDLRTQISRTSRNLKTEIVGPRKECEDHLGQVVVRLEDIVLSLASCMTLRKSTTLLQASVFPSLRSSQSR